MRGKYVSRPTRKYLDAVAALRSLPLDERGRAYAEATEDELTALATKSFGKIRKGREWQRVAGIKPDLKTELPADDHGELRTGKHLTYTSQPYDLGLAEMREIVRLCDELGLTVEVDARSWYFPGGTIRMTYRKRRTSN